MDKDHLKHIKDRMQSHEEFIDKDALWQSLGIEEEKKKRILPIWWFGGLLVLLGFLAIGTVLWTNSNELSSTEMLARTTEKTANTGILKSKKDASNKTKNGNNSNTNALHSTEIDKVQKPSSSRVKTQTQHTINRAVVAQNELIQKPRGSQLNLMPTNQRTILKEKQGNNELKGSTPTTSNEIVNSSKNNEKEPDYSSNSNKVVSSISEKDNAITNATTNAHFASIPRIKLRVLKVESELFQIDEEIKLNKKLASSLESKWKWNIGAAIGIFDIASTSSDIEYEPLLNYRNDHQKKLETLGLSGGISYSFSPHLYLSTGIMYQRLTQRLNYQNVSLRQVSGNQPTSINVNLQGDTSFVEFGEVTGVSEDVTYFTTYNEHHLINVPITVGFKKSLGRLNYFLEGGPIFNLNHTFLGKAFNEVGALATETTEYKTSFGLGLSLGFGLQYPISDRMSLYFKPRYTRWIKPITVSEALISQKLSTGTIEVGAEFSF